MEGLVLIAEATRKPFPTEVKPWHIEAIQLPSGTEVVVAMASDINLPNKEERDLNQSWWACVGKHAGVDSPVWKIRNRWMQSCG